MVTSWRMDPALFAKKVLVLCYVSVKHEESLRKLCFTRARNTVATVMMT